MASTYRISEAYYVGTRASQVRDTNATLLDAVGNRQSPHLRDYISVNSIYLRAFMRNAMHLVRRSRL